MSDYLVDPYKSSVEVYDTRYCEKNEAKNFSSLESVPFSFKNNCVLNNLLGVTELIL